MLIHHLFCLISALATIIVIVIAIQIMLGIVPPGEATKQIAAVLGLITVFVIALRILYTIWSGMSPLSFAALIVFGVFLWWLRHRVSKRKGEKE
jgi:fumarate reductase subunit D